MFGKAGLGESTVDAGADLVETLTHADFVLTESDGSWRDRAEFVARMRKLAPLPNASFPLPLPGTRAPATGSGRST